MLTDGDLQVILLPVKLAATVTLIPLLIGTPIVWWLARTRSFIRGAVSLDKYKDKPAPVAHGLS